MTHETGALPGRAPQHDTRPLIEARAISKRFGAAEIFRDVSLEVAPGERVALIGANGAGKTTLLRSLIGLTKIDAGNLDVFGERLDARNLLSARTTIRRQTGYVFQQHGLVRRRTALSNVVHGLMGRPGGWCGFSEMTAPARWREEAMAALADVRLADRAAVRADRLSGGQAQRVAIARALVKAPRLVIADEPTASLDPAAGREVMELFSKLVRARGIALLFTSHDMEHARAYSDRVVALRAGTIAFDRPSAALGDADLQEVFDG